MAASDFRLERDSMGELRVPADALWGAQTQRAVQNFQLSGLRMPRGFIRALGLVKWAAAGANAELGQLDRERAAAIQAAALRCSHSPLNLAVRVSRRLSNCGAGLVPFLASAEAKTVIDVGSGGGGDKEQTAKEIRQKLLGGAEFERMAQMYSEDESTSDELHAAFASPATLKTWPAEKLPVMAVSITRPSALPPAHDPESS